MPPRDPSVAYNAQVGALWANVLGTIGGRWSGLKSWRDSDVASFQRLALPKLLAAERTMATLTASYLEQAYRDVAKEVSPRVALDFEQLTGAALRNGTDPVDEYKRPFTVVWTALSKGESLDAAVKQGENRLTSLLKTDLQLARTHTARAVMAQQPKIKYYMRVVQGEYNCALCLVAATQRYRKEHLLPIHPGCDCEVRPIEDSFDPGQVIDEERLLAIHAAVEAALGTSDRGGRAVDYRKVIVQHTHGEIGPVLGFKGQHFTGPKDIKLPT